MVVQTPVSRPTERIERMVTLIEHVWKLYPQLTFGAVLRKVVGESEHDEHADFESWSDDRLEEQFREFLRRIFATGRDST